MLLQVASKKMLYAIEKILYAYFKNIIKRDYFFFRYKLSAVLYPNGFTKLTLNCRDFPLLVMFHSSYKIAATWFPRVLILFQHIPLFSSPSSS